MMKKFANVMAAAFMLIAFTGCKEESSEPAAKVDTNPVEQGPNLSFKIQNRFGTEKLDFSALKYINAAGNQLSVSKLAYLLSNFVLIKEDGTELPINDYYAYINTEQERDTFNFTLPDGTYTGIRFMLGLDSAINHGNPNQWKFGHALDPITSGLFWGWAGGYVFMALEGKVNILGKEEAYVYHISRDNTHGVVYELNFAKLEVKQGSAQKLNLALDAAEFFTNPDEFNLEGEARFLHTSSASGDKLVRNMHHVFSVIR